MTYVQEKIRQDIQGKHHGEIISSEVYHTAYDLSPESDNWQNTTANRGGVQDTSSQESAG